ncbi:MAG: DNA replication protein [Kiloniellales bacterium]
MSAVAIYQYPLRLPPLKRFGREDFLVGQANRAALAFVEAWPQWPTPTLILRGPKGAGKSHLAHIWQLRSRALVLDGSALALETVRDLLGDSRALLIENADRLLAERPDLQPAFYALFCAIAERQGSMLLTARQTPASWPLDLADLRSRLLGATQVSIGMPDDALLLGVLMKLLSDRQLESNPSVFRFLLPRIERSMGALQDLADRLDAGAMAARRRRRRVTMPLAKRALRALDSGNDNNLYR